MCKDTSHSTAMEDVLNIADSQIGTKANTGEMIKSRCVVLVVSGKELFPKVVVSVDSVIYD